MADSRKPPEVQPKRFESIEEIDLGIAKFKQRIEEVKKLDPTKMRYDAPEVKSVEERIAETIRDVFGLHSPEVHHHPWYQIWSNVPSVEDSDWEEQQEFVRGVPDTIVFLQGFVKRLEEERQHLHPQVSKAATGEPNHKPSTLRQASSGPVNTVVGGGLANIKITAVMMLSLIEETMKKSNEIPPEEKHALLERIKDLMNNRWIQATGPILTGGMLKRLLERHH
jgi:hypothetical protein